MVGKWKPKACDTPTVNDIIIQVKKIHHVNGPASTDLFTVNNENTPTMHEICLKLTIKDTRTTSMTDVTRDYFVSIVGFGQVNAAWE